MQYTCNLRTIIMSISTVFTNNRTQAVRLPADVRLPEDVKQVTVRAKGKERIIAPLQSSWDSFFMADTQATDDFMAVRATQTQPERENLD
jgi:antitoxin VapB